MTYRNRDLVRKPHAMLRINAQEQEAFDWLVAHEGGGSPAEIYRRVLLEAIRAKRHAMNPIAPNRLDTSAFALRGAA